MPTAGDKGAGETSAGDTDRPAMGGGGAGETAAPDTGVRDTGAADSPLISVAELADALAGREPPALIDVRWRLGGPPGIDSYRAGHLPGAVYVDLDTQLAGPPGAGGRHPLPATADFEAAMRAAGVRPDRDVVVYDDADATIAARAWWLLRYFGFGSHAAGGEGVGRVRVLDGGFRAWVAAGRQVGTAEETAAPGDFTADPGHMPVLDADGARAVARSGILLDARAPARYRGETEPVDPVAGHIPGALSAPTAENVNSDGFFRSAAELRARFADLGIGAAQSGQPPQPVAAYCGSGVTAAHEVLALELAGIPAALYVGSWSGWIGDPSRPVATGPQPGRPS
jgi:thiosulfate/3-mercaptopyruvate sulfurtransferase